MSTKCPLCAGSMRYRNEDWKFHAYDCLDEKCAGTSPCDHDCCRIMTPERAFDLIISENKIKDDGWKHKRIMELLRLVHQHGRES